VSDSFVIPAFEADPSGSSYAPRWVSVRCSRCLNSTLVEVIHNSIAGSETGEVDDGRPFIFEQLGRLGWAVTESADGPTAECRYHDDALAEAEHVTAEFDVCAVDVIANVYTLRCAACASSFTVTVRQRPDELPLAAGDHFAGCQRVAFAWTDWRSVAARREGALTTFELIGSRV
jgi:hypothetical protein